MQITVLEVLENAEFSLIYGLTPFQKELALNQLQKALRQLEENPDAKALFEDRSE